MRLALSCLLVLAPLPAAAHDDSERVLATASDLRAWCEAESQARLVARALRPANWTARHHEKGNTLIVEGKWRVDGQDVAVTCRAARGAREAFASIEMDAAD